MTKRRRSVPSEVWWAIGIGSALHFPLLWGVILIVAAWRGGQYLELQAALRRQSRQGPTVLKIDGRKFTFWLHADGTHTAREILAIH